MTVKKTTKTKLATLRAMAHLSRKRAAKVNAQPKPVPTAVPPNVLFPGRDNYVGPQTGYFTMIHHQQLLEHTREMSYATINDRVNHVRTFKAPSERPTRLRDMMYVGDCKVVKALISLEAARQHVCLEVYETRRPVEQALENFRGKLRTSLIAYISHHNPTHSWDEARHEMKFPSTSPFPPVLTV